MIRKNPFERRFNTAGARIMMTNKLPSDFFLPSREKDGRESSLCSYRHEDMEKHSYISLNKDKDPLLFTFHKSSSTDKIKVRRYELPEKLLLKNNSSSKLETTKLPPVSLAISKENAEVFWGKEMKGTK
jgi:hypothetical protein